MLIDSTHVRVGVAVLLRQGDAALMGLRKGSHGAGTWSFPGGHLEPGETVTECGARELREETGIEIDPARMHKITFTNDVFKAEGKHYVTLYVGVGAEASPGAVARLMEPGKCEEWRWWSEPPPHEKLFLPIRNLLRDGHKIWPVFGPGSLV